MLAVDEDSLAEKIMISWRRPFERSRLRWVRVRGPTVALLLSLVPVVLPAAVAVHAQEKTAVDPEEAAKAKLRPICADQAARAGIVSEMIKRGGEYERATAKWDLDVTCEQIDLPVNPMHDTADPSDAAAIRTRIDTAVKTANA